MSGPDRADRADRAHRADQAHQAHQADQADRADRAHPAHPSASPPAGTRASRVELFRLALAERHHPDPFYRRLAARTVDELAFPIRGRRIVDLGSGPGYYTAALRDAGGVVTAIDVDATSVARVAVLGLPAIQGDAGRLPLPTASIDGVFCSNLFEHVPLVGPLLDEIARVLRIGGWGWISWTNWFSPWGGHGLGPLHYLGPGWGPRLRSRLGGGPRRGAGRVWPTYVGRILCQVRSRPELRLLDATPRYYPSQRWVVGVPGWRELATWNCLMRVERVRSATTAGPAGPGTTATTGTTATPGTTATTATPASPRP